MGFILFWTCRSAGEGRSKDLELYGSEVFNHRLLLASQIRVVREIQLGTEKRFLGRLQRQGGQVVHHFLQLKLGHLAVPPSRHPESTAVTAAKWRRVQRE